jgi:hypothetical protein
VDSGTPAVEPQAGLQVEADETLALDEQQERRSRLMLGREWTIRRES